MAKLIVAQVLCIVTILQFPAIGLGYRPPTTVAPTHATGTTGAEKHPTTKPGTGTGSEDHGVTNQHHHTPEEDDRIVNMQLIEESDKEFKRDFDYPDELIATQTKNLLTRNIYLRVKKMY